MTMTNIDATLKALRYFDRLVISGKRMVVDSTYTDPCDREGHEPVLAFCTVYVNDPTVKAEHFSWDHASIKHLEHINSCPYCLSRVFSVPDAKLHHEVEQKLMCMVG